MRLLVLVTGRLQNSGECMMLDTAVKQRNTLTLYEVWNRFRTHARRVTIMKGIAHQYCIQLLLMVATDKWKTISFKRNALRDAQCS